MSGLVPFNRNRSIKPSGFKDFYDMLDDFFTDTNTSFPRSLAKDTFKVDIQEKGNEYCIEAEIPGAKKEEINLELNDGKLTITVEREKTSEDEQKNYIHRERRYSSMQRSIYLADAETDGIKAKLEDGVLNITIPKEKKKENLKKIDIE